LIDNGSTDNYEEKIKKYAPYYTLIKDSTRLKYGTQTYLYNKLYLDIVKKETTWLLICDIDEYIYSRNEFNTISSVLQSLPNNVEKIWLAWKSFGSNGIQKQPISIVDSFIKRSIKFDSKKGEGKVIIKTENLDCIQNCGHRAKLLKNDIYYTCNGQTLDSFILNEKNYNKLNLHNNHYRILSYEYISTVKSVRGGGEFGKNNRYTMKYLQEIDKKYNDIIDEELKNKKNNYKNIYQKINNIWYCYKKHFTRKNDKIISIKDTIIKKNTSHSNQLVEDQKKNITVGTSFLFESEIHNYFVIHL